MKYLNVLKMLMVLLLLCAVLIGCAQEHADVTQTVETTEQTIPTEETTEPATEEATEETKAKVYAPNFTVYDLDGKPVKLSDFYGKPVVLNFWSSNCPTCVTEMPEFQQVYQEYGEEVNFVMVNFADGSWDTVDSAWEFISNNGYTFPVYYDTAMYAANAYMVTSLPATFYIDEEGYAVAYKRGRVDYETLVQGIAMLQ